MTFFDHYFNLAPNTDGSLPSAVACPFCGVQASLMIKNWFDFECFDCMQKGSIFDFTSRLEGIPPDLASVQVSAITEKSEDIHLPLLVDIQRCHESLMGEEGNGLRAVLGSVYGLDDTSLRRANLGLEATSGELIIPIFNATGLNISGAKYLTLDPNGGMNGYRLRCVNRLIGYSYRRFSGSSHSPVFVVENDLDRICLERMDFLAVSAANGIAEWDDSFAKLLRGHQVVVTFTDRALRDEKSLEVLSDLSKKVKRLSRINVTNLRKRTKAEVESSLSQAKELTIGNLTTLSLINSAQMKGVAKKKVHLAQDFVDDMIVYGVRIGTEPFLLTSSRALLPLNKMEGYEGVTAEPESSRMTVEAVSSFVAGDMLVDPHKVLDEIRSYIRRFVVFSDESTFSLLATWVLGTYCFRVFDSFPYIHLQAEKGSGKTRVMDILHPICFNGEFSSNQTAPVIFRDVHNSACTMFLDEVEYLRKADTATHGEIMRILNSGYQSSGKVKRVGKNKGSEEYSTYSPKMFAGINDITDTLDQRSIRIRMGRALSNEKVDRYRAKDAGILALQSSLRDQLYVLGLQYGQRINALYREIESSPFMSGIFNRKSDLWGPLLVMSQLADEGRNDGKSSEQEALISYLNIEQALHARADGEENMTRSLAIVLKQALKEIALVSEDGVMCNLRTEDVFDLVAKHPETKGKFKTVHKLTSALSEKLGIAVGVKNVGGRQSKRCYLIDRARLDDGGLRAGAWTQEDLQSETQKKKRTSQRYFPKRVIVTEKAQSNPMTQIVLEKIRALSPDVVEESSSDEKVPEPNILVNSDMYAHFRETVVLASRSSNFMEIFPSPGTIVEDMNTMCKVLIHCSSKCQYCYLQLAGGDSARWQKLWTNLDDLERQCNIELLFNKTALTIWSAISFYKQETFPKVPEGFKEVADKLRGRFLRKDDPILTDEAAKQHLETALANLLIVDLGLDHDPKQFNDVHGRIRAFYNENSKRKPWFNIGEYGDIVAVDHLTGYLETFMRMLQSNPELRLELSTKSAGFSNILKHPAYKRLCVGMNFNTEYIVDRYEGGTSTLDERFDAMKSLFQKGDVLLKFTIEPIIKYEGYVEEYRKLSSRIASEFPLSNPLITSMKVGGVRYRKQLAQEIQKNHPGIDLFAPFQGLVEPEGDDQRMRYPEAERLEIYRVMKNELSDAGEKFTLGCEFPRVWERLGLDWKSYIARSVYQYPG